MKYQIKKIEKLNNLGIKDFSINLADKSLNLFHFGTEISTDFENNILKITGELKKLNNYEKSSKQKVQSRLIDSEDRRWTYETWLRTNGGKNKQSGLQSIIEKALESNRKRETAREYEETGNEYGENGGRSGSNGEQSVLNDTQQFFSDTVKGGNKPIRPWFPQFGLSEKQKLFFLQIILSKGKTYLS
ncbi:hypothetical protein KRX57_10255 [Weeksellaceae bacterium TAE3-ERU29]|nr:hypothetical protein [Weeksellaceae bacterium TAE3-ERU29]